MKRAGPRRHAGQDGFITMFVLMTAGLTAVLLGTVIQVHYALHNSNQRRLQQIQERLLERPIAVQVHVDPEQSNDETRERRD